MNKQHKLLEAYIKELFTQESMQGIEQLRAKLFGLRAAQPLPGASSISEIIPQISQLNDIVSELFHLGLSTNAIIAKLKIMEKGTHFREVNKLDFKANNILKKAFAPLFLVASYFNTLADVFVSTFEKHKDIAEFIPPRPTLDSIKFETQLLKKTTEGYEPEEFDFPDNFTELYERAEQNLFEIESEYPRTISQTKTLLSQISTILSRYSKEPDVIVTFFNSLSVIRHPLFASIVKAKQLASSLLSRVSSEDINKNRAPLHNPFTEIEPPTQSSINQQQEKTAPARPAANINRPLPATRVSTNH